MATIEDLERRLRNLELQSELDATARTALEQLTFTQLLEIRGAIFPEEKAGVAQTLGPLEGMRAIYKKHVQPIVGSPSPAAAPPGTNGSKARDGATIAEIQGEEPPARTRQQGDSGPDKLRALLYRKGTK